MSAERQVDADERVGAASGPPRPHLELPRGRRIGVTLGVMLGMFLAALEATVVSTAMPTVVAALGGIERYSWVFSAYLLTSTVTVPVWGKLSDLYGRKRVYQIGIAIFLVGSALSGLSATMEQLIAWRALQGLGAGALVPLALTIIGEIYTIQERARMQGAFSGVWGVASVLGPLVGGYITDQISWRWVFYMNLPFGLLAAVIIGAMLVEPPRERRPRIDYAGAAALTASMTLLLFGLVEGAHLWGLASPPTLALFALAAALFVVFVRVELRVAEPIVPLDIFRDRTFAVSSLCGLLAGVGMFGAISFIPLFVQGVTGASATAAGSALTPLMLAWVSLSVVGGRLLHNVGVRPMVVTGLGLLVVGFVVLASFGRGTPLSWILADMALMGAGMGLTYLTLLIAVQAAVTRERLGVATSLTMFTRSIGGALGVATMGLVIAASLGPRIAAYAPGADVDVNNLLDPAVRSTLDPAILAGLEAALAESLRGAFWLGAVVAAIALVAAFWLPQRLATAPSR